MNILIKMKMKKKLLFNYLFNITQKVIYKKSIKYLTNKIEKINKNDLNEIIKFTINNREIKARQNILNVQYTKNQLLPVATFL